MKRSWSVKMMVKTFSPEWNKRIPIKHLTSNLLTVWHREQHLTGPQGDVLLRRTDLEKYLIETQKNVYALLD